MLPSEFYVQVYLCNLPLPNSCYSLNGRPRSTQLDLGPWYWSDGGSPTDSEEEQRQKRDVCTSQCSIAHLLLVMLLES